MSGDPRTSSALEELRRSGSVAALRERARRRRARQPLLVTNTHVHLPPNFSAFRTVTEALDLAAADGVGVLGASNYYDYTVYGELARGARERGIFPLFGIEVIAMDEELQRAGVLVNDPGNPGKFYLCGKGIVAFEAMRPAAERLITRIRRGDGERIRAMIARIADRFTKGGVPLPVAEASVVDGIVRRHGSPRSTVFLQERHVAQAFQEALFEALPAAERPAALARACGEVSASVDPDDPVAVQGELRSRLMKAGKPAYIEEDFVTFEEARRLVLELGGIPSYPTLADGTEPLCGFEQPIERLLENVLARDLHAAELIPVRNRPELLREYVTAMRRAGLIVTAGTEHNTLDRLPLAPTCRGGVAIPADVDEIFREGACVVAAHQFLRAHGEEGFVDAAGRPHAGYREGEARIAAFAELGAAVIETYREGER